MRRFLLALLVTVAALLGTATPAAAHSITYTGCGTDNHWTWWGGYVITYERQTRYWGSSHATRHYYVNRHFSSDYWYSDYGVACPYDYS